MAAACKRLAQLSGFGFSKSFSFNSSLRSFSRLSRSNGQPYIDKFAIVSRLERQGLPRKQAEAITAAITDVLNYRLKNLSESLMQMQRTETELRDSQMQLQHEIEKLRNNMEKMEKMNKELRYEIGEDAFKVKMKPDLFCIVGSIVWLAGAVVFAFSSPSGNSS